MKQASYSRGYTVEVCPIQTNTTNIIIYYIIYLHHEQKKQQIKRILSSPQPPPPPPTISEHMYHTLLSIIHTDQTEFDSISTKHVTAAQKRAKLHSFVWKMGYFIRETCLSERIFPSQGSPDCFATCGACGWCIRGFARPELPTNALLF